MGNRPELWESAMRVVKATGRLRWGGEHLMRLAVAAVVAFAGVCAAFSANAQARGGMGGPDRGHGMSMFDGQPEHIDRKIDQLLDGLNTSDAQRAQIKQIAMAAAADLRGQRNAGRALREKGMQIFAAPTVDAAAAESLRQQMLAQHDQASKRTLQALLDVSKVLTPEQRAKAAARMQERVRRDRGPEPQK
jgi:periplasmic protein CpxP/Spy